MMKISRIRQRLQSAEKIVSVAVTVNYADMPIDKLIEHAVRETAGDGVGDEELVEKKSKRNIRTLKIFADGEAMKLAQKLYFQYISQSDAGGFLTFVTDLDGLMSEHREDSKDPINLEPESEEDEEEETVGVDGDDDGEDEDETDGVDESVMRKILKRVKRRRLERERG